jgi:hypothetical protein
LQGTLGLSFGCYVLPLVDLGARALGPVSDQQPVIRQKIEYERAHMSVLLERRSAFEILSRDPWAHHRHVAGPMDGGWWALDVWDSPERLQQYVASDLGPAMQKHRFPQVQPKMFQVHNMLKS